MSYQYRGANGGPNAPQIVAPPMVMPAPVRPRGGIYRNHFKRVLDLSIVLMASVPVAFTVFLMAFIISLDGHKPLYFQDRIGRGGRVFRMFKLRTMVVDADRVLDAHLAADPAARAEWDHHQKLRHDPRITRIGRVLRRTSMDELPQLWNVFIGDMSIVGPRPMMRSQRVLYPGTEYYDMRPGITGYWQISVRNEFELSRAGAIRPLLFRGSVAEDRHFGHRPDVRRRVPRHRGLTPRASLTAPRAQRRRTDGKCPATRSATRRPQASQFSRASNSARLERRRRS